MWHRLKPAFSLVLLSPLIAEYLLGSLTFAQLAFFPIMALMYGVGSLFVREIARRTGRGWPTIMGLGLAYGMIEEGLVTQSFFNPHYLGLRLLDYGFVPALGIGVPWCIYIVILHAVWSVAVPIALVEALFPAQRTTPWLSKPGLVVCGVIYLVGSDLVAYGTRTKEHFVASVPQLVTTAVVVAITVVAALFLFKPARSTPVRESRPLKGRPSRLGLLAFGMGSLFQITPQIFWGAHLPPVAAVALSLVLPAIMVMVYRSAQESEPWTVAQTNALMLGGLFAYCWLGFFLTARLHGISTIPGQFFPFTIVISLIYLRFVRRPRAKAEV